MYESIPINLYSLSNFLSDSSSNNSLKSVEYINTRDCDSIYNKCHKNLDSEINDFIVFGDWGELCNTKQKKTADNMLNYNKNIDLVISVGDNFYHPDSDEDDNDDFDEQLSKKSQYDKLIKQLKKIPKKDKNKIARIKRELDNFKLMDSDKMKRKSLLKYIYDGNYEQYIKYQFKHSFINCYKHLLSKPWYLCLGNHDVEPIGHRDDMGLYQICADKYNTFNPFCDGYEIPQTRLSNWNMPSFYWNAIHNNVQFLFLDTNMLHFLEINNFITYINILKSSLLLRYNNNQQQSIINKTYNRIIEKIAILNGINTKEYYEYFKKRDTKFSFYNNMPINSQIDNQLKWFINCLLNNNLPWNIVIGHHPPHFYPHKDKPGKDIGIMPPICIISLLIQLYNCISINIVQAYFSGHVHNCQHIYNSESLCHEIITGNGGTDLDKTKNKNIIDHYKNKHIDIWDNLQKYGLETLLDYNNVYDKSHGFVKCSISEDTLLVDIIYSNNETIAETISIPKTLF
tara:strand:+ start:450 stop:1988 length:1539 start_codon:yes stop_codon:yes gene_type:complete